MSCGCKSGTGIRSWNDFQSKAPVDPRDFIAYATFGLAPIPGTWYLSDNYSQPDTGSIWIDSPISVNGAVTVTTNATEQKQMVFDATSWNFQNKSTNTAASVAPPLRKVIFVRSGLEWINTVPLALGSSPDFTELQLSLLENAATRGDMQGSIPVFRWASGPFLGSVLLQLVFRIPGRYALGLVGINNASAPEWSMFELDIVAV